MGDGMMELVALRAFSHSVGTVEAGQKFKVARSYGQELVRAGIASGEAPRGRWAGGTAVAMGSGPSLTAADVELVRAWRAGGAGRYVAVTNTTFRTAPWANLLYAADKKWWDVHYKEASSTFEGELWTQDDLTRKNYGVRHVQCERRFGLSRIPGVIHNGGNSGHQLVGLLVNQGVKKIILLGYDMQLGPAGEKHHHGDHPAPLRQNVAFEPWLRNFKEIAMDAATLGISIINASRSTALTCVPRYTLETALEAANG